LKESGLALSFPQRQLGCRKTTIVRDKTRTSRITEPSLQVQSHQSSSYSSKLIQSHLYARAPLAPRSTDFALYRQFSPPLRFQAPIAIVAGILQHTIALCPVLAHPSQAFPPSNICRIHHPYELAYRDLSSQRLL
jgi:hypothetical protein